ncbi:ATP-dependent DNA ligase [Candidatus Woesearchaeota archaeon]|jgi:DNA ligase 1|nr:ATP-dependent DNA ligase [Candidatus Woesearchaeota archaeon]MBT4150377.1 ATP-dependent DNA ligase [Candidatus Woesearchaeota archaeon]MBT4247377.1 ATP-dependent DNA ligase [Candidatus Woesearchaeota archaeon]MBT4434568.1 ATP-dependent DNA ligase [Candidatus Woesearchaeota archaeon]MBT7332009.1 ATP-dependent DNA ligase [Candidatus Woesearchaeota archaeon]
MDFQKLVDVYEELEKVSSGNKMREILADFFKTVPKEDIAIVAYLTLGKFSSDYENAVLGFAERSILKAISSAAGVSSGKVRESNQKTGDAGLTAEIFLKHKPQTLVPVGKLTIHDLFDNLKKLADTSGTGSQDQKSIMLVRMYQQVSSKGAKYLTRIVLGTLRMGVGDMTVLDALAIAYTGEKKNKEILENAYNICPDVGVMAETIAKKGLKGLEKIEVQVGRPIKMMLAQRIGDLDDLEKKMPGKVSVEGKYDGERVQAHKTKDGKIQLFSRRLDNTTAQFPDLVKYLEDIKAKEFILEGEILAIDENGKPLAFQTLMQRRRKNDVEEYIKKVPVQIKVFDLLYVNGKTVFNDPFQERRKIINKIVPKGKHIMPAEEILTDDVEEINDFFQKMLDDGYEGIMIKALDGVYQAGTRGWNWIKWKKEYVKEMSDTFDLVVVGAYYGRGRRSGVYGALLCAVYDSENDSFETLCKLGTGLTDSVLEELPEKLKRYESSKKPARVNCKKEMIPDVWFKPGVVVDVLAAELTKSPFHTAGVALRFPRFLRFRDDKKAEQATTVKEVSEI